MSNKQSSAKVLEQVKAFEGVSFNYSIVMGDGKVWPGFDTRESARKMKRGYEEDGETGIKILQHKTITTYIR